MVVLLEAVYVKRVDEFYGLYSWLLLEELDWLYTHKQTIHLRMLRRYNDLPSYMATVWKIWLSRDRFRERIAALETYYPEIKEVEP